MRRKQKIQAEKAGIILLSDKTTALDEKKRKSNQLHQCVQLFFVITFMAACILCFVTGFSLPALKKVLVIVTVVLGSIFFLTFSISKKMELLLAAELICYSVIAFQFQGDISKGFTIVLNRIILEIRRYYGIILPELSQVNQNKEYYVTVFLCFILFFLIGITTYLFIHRVPKLITVLLGSVFALSSLAVGYLPQDIYFVTFIILCVAILGSGVVEKKGPKMEGEYAGVILSIVGCLVAAMVILLFPPKTYESKIYTKPMKIKIQKIMKGDFKRLFDGDLLFGGVASGGLNKGKLGRVSEVEFTYDTMMEVKISDIYSNYTTYLRGYVGSEYNGNHWSPLSGRSEREESEIEKKHKIGMEEVPINFQKLFGDYKWEFTPEYDSSIYYSDENLIHSPIRDWWNMETCSIENILEDSGTIFMPYMSTADSWIKHGRVAVNGINGRKYKNSHYYGGQLFLDSYLANGETRGFFARVNGMIKEFETAIGMTVETYLDTQKEKNKDRRLEEILSVKVVKDRVTGDVSSSDVELEDWVHPNQFYRYSYDPNKKLNDVAEIIQQCKNLKNAESEYSKHAKETYTNVPEELKEKMSKLLKKKKIPSYKKKYVDFKESWSYKEIFGENNENYPEGFCEGLYYDVYSNSIEYDSFSRGDEYKELKYDEEKKQYYYVEDEYYLAKRVRTMLKETTGYTLKPGALPSGKDFVEYFLTESHKGYCSHYASAGVILLRTLGVPARYVEGYAIQKDQFQTKNGILCADVKDSNAHAWIEIYKDGIGWISVEMTPSYYSPGKPDQVVEVMNPEETIAPTKAPESEETEEVESTMAPNKTSKPEKHTTLPEKEHKIPFFVYSIIVIVPILLTMVAFLAVRRKLVLLIRKNKKFEIQREAVFYYINLEKLMHLNKCIPKKCQLRKYEELENANTGILDVEEWNLLKDIANQMAFSEKGVSKEQLADLKEIYIKVYLKILDQSSRLKRWYLVYIKLFP